MVKETRMHLDQSPNTKHRLLFSAEGRLRRHARSNDGILSSLLIALTILSLLYGGNLHAEAQKQSVIYRTAASIQALSEEQANRADPAHLRGVVSQTLSEGLTIQDQTGGVWIYLDHPEEFTPGDEIEVEGVVDPGLFAPVVKARSVHRLGRASLPKPKDVSYKQISTGSMDCQYVSVTGWVRSAGVRKGAAKPQGLWLRIVMQDGTIDAMLPTDEAAAAEKLIGAQVRIDATAFSSKNQRRQITMAHLSIPDMRFVTVLQPPPHDLFAIPLTPIGKLMQYRSGTDYDQRVRVVGIVTYYNPGDSLILEDGSQALLVKTGEDKEIRVGDRVEAVGFAAPQNSGPILQDAVLRRIASGPLPQPTLVKISDISSGRMNNNLISVEGHLVRRVHEPFREVLLVQDDSAILLAELSQPGVSDPFPQLREGSKIRLSGISILEVEGTWNYGLNSAYALRYKILLRSLDDIQMLEPPSWWTTRHVLYIAAALGILVLAFLAQLIVSRIEQWRLEAVLEERERLAHEIHDTLAQSFAGIAFQLQAILKAIPRNLPDLKEQVNLTRELVRHSHKEARRSIEPLQLNSPQEVDPLSSLESLARNIVKGGPVNILTGRKGNPRLLSPPIADALLRIGQEAIANAVRHAEPKNLTITLSYEESSVQLTVLDDGHGFVKSGDLLGFGLRGMRKRAAVISGRLDITSRPGQGTCVTVTAPLPPVNTLFSSLRYILKFVGERIFHVQGKQQPNPDTDC
jgi:signal transduction histidine kinase